MIVTVTVPRAAVALAVRVSALVVVAGFGLKAAVTPFGNPDADSVTFPVNPFTGAIVIVLVPLLPCVMLTLLGAAARLKFSGVFTVRLNVVVLVNVPDVPVTVTVTVPVAAVALAVKVSVLVVVAGLGSKDAVTPFGRPDAEKVTLPLNPFSGLIMMVLITLVPCVMVTGLGWVRLKFDVPGQSGNTKLPIAVLQSNPSCCPVKCKYSSLNQKVQSSVGSTVIEV